MSLLIGLEENINKILLDPQLPCGGYCSTILLSSKKEYSTCNCKFDLKRIINDKEY